MKQLVALEIHIRMLESLKTKKLSTLVKTIRLSEHKFTGEIAMSILWTLACYHCTHWTLACYTAPTEHNPAGGASTASGHINLRATTLQYVWGLLQARKRTSSKYVCRRNLCESVDFIFLFLVLHDIKVKNINSSHAAWLEPEICTT